MRSLESDKKVPLLRFKTSFGNCLVPRRLSFDESVRAKEGGKETTGETRFASGRKNVLRKLLRILYRRLKAGFSVC